MQRIELKDLQKTYSKYADQVITICGWARTIRDSKNIAFLELNDGAFKGAQVVIEREKIANYDEIVKQNIGASFKVEGKLILTPNAQQPFELNAKSVEILGECAEVMKMLDGPTLLGNKSAAAVDALGRLEDSCYVCGRVEKNLSAMIATAVYLYESDFDFREKLKAQPWFCLPHYRRLVDYASRKMPKRIFKDFYRDLHGLERKYLEELSGDVSWFCKKFDYRYDEEPWYNSKDAVKRGIKFLGGSFGEEEATK